MQTVEPAAPIASPPSRRRPLYIAGVLLFFLGLAISVVQFQLHHFGVPWYLPIFATAGVLLMAISVFQRRGILRIVGLVILGALCGFEWLFLLVLAKTPDYAGPAQAGQPVPSFTAAFADGKTFTEQDLKKGDPTVLLFYRGHW